MLSKRAFKTSLDENGKSAVVPGLVVDSEEGVRRFARSIQRKNQSIERAEEFDDIDFDLQGHLDDLNGENVEIELT